MRARLLYERDRSWRTKGEPCHFKSVGGHTLSENTLANSVLIANRCFIMLTTVHEILSVVSHFYKQLDTYNFRRTIQFFLEH